jgi:hypothetical protein
MTTYPNTWVRTFPRLVRSISDYSQSFVSGNFVHLASRPLFRRIERRLHVCWAFHFSSFPALFLFLFFFLRQLGRSTTVELYDWLARLCRESCSKSRKSVWCSSNLPVDRPSQARQEPQLVNTVNQQLSGAQRALGFFC